MTTPLLKIEDLEVSYGKVPAVNGVSLEIFPGDMRVVLGANGAGKSTIIKTIMGLQKPRGGSIRFDGDTDLLRLKPHKIHALGIAWVPEARQLWNTLTVIDNLRLGGWIVRDAAVVERRIQEMFERFFATESTSARVRAAEPTGFDPALWRELVALDLRLRLLHASRRPHLPLLNFHLQALLSIL